MAALQGAPGMTGKVQDAAGSSSATKASSPKDDSSPAEKPATPPKPKTPANFIMHGVRIFDAVAVFMALTVIVIARFLRPGFWSTLMYTAVGLPVGVAMSFLYFKRKKDKRTRRQLYNVEPGAKGITELLQKIPTWLTLSQNEKCEWLNDILLEMWPFYDYAVCEMVKEICGPIFESVKPPFMKKLGFRKLQFGDAPIRIEAVRMNRERKEGVFLEMDFRWAGDPDIQLFVDAIGGGEAAQICPKISNIRLVGTVGVHLRPIVDEIPGFGVLIITLLKPPKINYRVDLGAAMGGSLVGGSIAAFVNDLIPQILNGFLVWPERIVSPIVDPKFFGSVEDYMLRHQGVLKVEVLEAREIPRMDKMGTSDPSVRIFTDPKRRVETGTKKNTLNPVWENEVFYLMVQEPESQFLRWEMFDTDAVNMKAMFKGVNIVKGLKDSVNSKELMCKGEVNLNDVCVCHPGETVDRWFPMGSEDWSADDGPGKDCGEIKLRLTYVPLSRVNPLVGQRGNFFVYPKKGRDFPRMVPKSAKSTNPYYVGKIGNDKQTGNTMYNTTEPDWTGSGIAFYGVSNAELLKLTFYHAGGLGMDSDLGEVTIEISDVRKGRDRDQRGCVRKDYDLQDADSGIVEIECLFVPEF